jgi:uncharacterized protein YyaL (SSP411 family)
MAATALLRLGHLCGETNYVEAAGRTLNFAESAMERMPTAVGQLLIALDFWLGPASELVLVGGSEGESNQKAIAALQQAFLPRSVAAYRGGSNAGSQSPALNPLFAGRGTSDKHPTLYVCENYACQAPIQGADAIRAAVEKL